MFNTLLYLSLAITCFAVWPGLDIREFKMILAIAFCLGLGMAEFYKHGLKPIKNHWLLLFICYVPISMMLAPVPSINLMGMDVMGFWAWQPFLKIVAFFILFLAISSHNFSDFELERILKIIIWCGFLTSLYVIMQYFYQDQFFKQQADGEWGRVAGFIGNPTLTAPFSAMIVPICLYKKDYIKAVFCGLGAVLPDSQMAWIALGFGLIVYFALKGPKWFISLGLAGALLATSYFLAFNLGVDSKNKALKRMFEDHERFVHWTQIYKDWTGPIAPEKEIDASYPLTGRGIGSFKYVYHIQHPNFYYGPNRFHQAHNDYLELGYGLGYVGLGLIIMSIIYMIQKNYSFHEIFLLGESGYKRALLASFSVMAITALGTFIWQIATTAFFTVIICGLIHNERKLI